MEKQRFPTNAADRSNARETPAGPYRLSVEHREVSQDGGLTIHVFGPKDGNDEELLRFDCFRTTPHYHVGLSYRDAPQIEIDDADPFNWSLSLLASSFGTLLEDAGADATERSTWESELDGALDMLRRQAATLTAEQ